MQRLEDSVDTNDDSDVDNSEWEKEYTELREKMNELYQNQRGLEFIDDPESPYHKEEQTVVYGEKYYEYTGLKNLNKNRVRVSTLLCAEPKIHICAFQVNTQGKYPFLQFFMQKFPETDPTNPDQITFPTFKYKATIDSQTRAESILDIMFHCYQHPGFYQYEGYYQEQENYYLFYDCSAYQIRVHDLYRKNDLWLITMDEILNNRMICGHFPIDPLVSGFFENHPEYIYLQNSQQENYELPIVVYVGSTAFQANYIANMGVSKSDKKNLFGSYFYFHDYVGAVHSAMEKYREKNTHYESSSKRHKPVTIFSWPMSKTQFTNIEGGLVRMALFIENAKIILHPMEEGPDVSETTQEMLKEDPTCASVKHRALVNYLKVSDRDGVWANYYDGVFLSDMEFMDSDAETRLHVGKMYVAREYDQQLPLSCHFLGTKTMEEKWSLDTNYYIK